MSTPESHSSNPIALECRRARDALLIDPPNPVTFNRALEALLAAAKALESNARETPGELTTCYSRTGLAAFIAKHFPDSYLASHDTPDDLGDQIHALLLRRGYAQHEAHAIAGGPGGVFVEPLPTAPSHLADDAESGISGHFQPVFDPQFKELEPFYPQAVEFAMSEETMSIVKLQRKFRLGYIRAARLIERLVAEKILDVDPVTGAYRRSAQNGDVSQR